MSAGTSLGSYFRNEGNGGIGKSTYMNANATAPSTATCTNRLILPPPTGDRRGRRENTLTTGLGTGKFRQLVPSPKSRSFVLTFSHPDYTVGSGLAPDPPRPFARPRVAGSPFHRNGITAGRESTPKGLTLPRRSLLSDQQKC